MPASATGATRIQLCGRLKADLADRHVTPALRGRQGRVLLAYLVLNRGRPVSRDELIAAIWPGKPPEDPAAALRTQLSRLRSAMGTGALAGRDPVELHLPQNTWIDIEAAEYAIDAADAALAASDWNDAWGHAHVALNISGRPFLAGFDAPWVEQVRRELAELQARARESIARAGIGLGGSELAGAERSARELIRSTPFRESGYLHLMRALVASGNTAEALRTYDQLRSLLASELGTAPGTEIQALHRRLLTGAVDTPEPPEIEVAEAATAPSAHGELPLPAWLVTKRRGPFVGREAELQALGDLWEEASAGRREIVLVGGDPGVGKTRLLTEFAQRVHDRGAGVLYGRADEEGTASYLPFVEALRHWAINAPPKDLERDLGPHAGVLARFIPEIGARLPEPPKIEAEEPARDLLFDAVTGTLAAIASSHATLLVIDDLHWTDTGSLLMLRHIARSPHRAGLLIAATYRETEPSDALAETLADLGREKLFERIHLAGLDTDEVTTLVATMQGDDPDPELAETIHAETGGNPFLVEALVQHLSEHGARDPDPARSALVRESIYAAGVPSLVQEAVAHRIGELGGAAERTLDVASAIGSEFEADLVVEVSGLESGEVIGALESAVAAGLLADVTGTLDRYAFGHALFRQTVYAGLPKSRRAELHRRIGEVLEQRHGSDPRRVGELARHFASAGSGSAGKALEYCVRAGAGALGSFGYEEATEHYTRALAAIETAPGADERLRCEVLLGLGESEWRAGQAEAARETFARAGRISRSAGDADALARAALGFCGYGWERFGVRDLEAEQLLGEALDAEPQHPNLRSQLMAHLAQALYFGGDPERADEMSRDAVRISRESGDGAALATALIGRWYACFTPEGLDERLQIVDELVELTEHIRSRDLAIQARMLSVEVSLETGDTKAVDRAISEHARLAEQTKQPGHELHSRAFRAMRALMQGHFDEAEQLAGEVLELGTLAHSPNALHYSGLVLYMLRWHQNRLGEFEEPLRDLIRRYGAVPAWRANLAFLLAELGRDDEAASELEALESDEFAALPRDAMWLPALGFLALTCLRIGDRDRAAELYELMLPWKDRIVVFGGAAAYAGPVSFYVGLLARIGDRPDDAVSHLTSAAEENERTGATPWLLHSRYQLALALHERDQGDDRERTREILADTSNGAEQLGMIRLLELIRASERTVSATA